MGGKNAQDAQSSGGAMGSQGGGKVSGGSGCPDKKHWIGVKVLDEDGNVVKDVTLHCKLDDGTTFDLDLSTASLAKDGTYKTKTILDASNCDFSFPSLVNSEWWPQGETAAKDPSNASSTAGDGDCALSLADAINLRAYHSMWDLDENNGLKTSRPNANMLVRGDIVDIPNKKDKVVTKAVDAIWTFVVKSRKPFKLRMVLFDKDDKPLSGKKWQLKTPISQKGTTGGDGLIEITGFKSSFKTGTLEVAMKDATKPPKKTAPTTTAPATPPYPPVIAPGDFKDEMPAPDFGAQKMEWQLKIGSLPPVKTKTGVLARLHSLGFGCDVDSDDPTTTRVVKAYQRFYLNNKNGSGAFADIQDDAGTRHDT